MWRDGGTGNVDIFCQLTGATAHTVSFWLAIKEASVIKYGDNYATIPLTARDT